MATKAHCAFCFETLSANLEDREALTLAQVEGLWNKYNADPSDLETTPATEASPSTPELSPIPSALDPTYRPAAISRLLANTPSSASSSSVPSTSSSPSRVSEASSATSRSSSRSSFSPNAAGKENAVPGSYASAIASPPKNESYPLFVTYNVRKKNGEKQLRGCIGSFSPHELEEGLSSYALTSAFDDTRFHPIALPELPTLEVGVTLLTDFEPVSDPMDWEIGVHGLRISFTYHGKRYGSTYLPSVAEEQGWTKEEAIVSLMRKAGWSGRSSEWRKVGISVVRYQGSQVKLGYEEWAEWREWVETEGMGSE